VTSQAALFEPERKPFAVFSECTESDSCPDEACPWRLYRYELWWPTGLDNDRVALGIFANPSKATPQKPDPTVTRWINYCRGWGYGWAAVGNARAWRETDPKKVPGDPRAIGPMNAHHLGLMIAEAKLIVCGWGKLGGEAGRRAEWLIRVAGKTPHALKLNKDGSPQHPLYLRADAQPFPMEER
jgi:hypothetical protein